MKVSGTAGPFDMLEGQRYVRLTTFRRSGKAVPTTVWFALVKDRAYVFTGANSGRDEEETPNRAIERKYGWQYRLFNRILELPRNPQEYAFLELRTAEDLE